MQEFIAEALALINLPFTILLGFILVYWGLVILGALDVDAFDFDLDLDAGDAGTGMPFSTTLGHFFHVNEGPFMAIFSILVVFMWMATMTSNHYLNSNHSWLWAGALTVPNFIISVTATKIVVFPVFRVLRKLKTSETPADVQLIGLICEVTTSEVTTTFGQAEVQREGSPITLNVRIIDGSKPLKRGDRAVIVFANKEQSIYQIRTLENSI